MNYELILGIDSSAVSASCCLLRSDFSAGYAILAQSYVNAGLTHSRTLLPLAESVLKSSGKDLSDVNCIAVSAGPGSFTGIRIGIATVKGLCFAREIPCFGVSALEAAAHGLDGFSGMALAVMDARRDQVYTAAFRLEDGIPVRETPDRAISIEDLAAETALIKDKIWLCGDGAQLVFDRMQNMNLSYNLALAPHSVRVQSGYGAALAARQKILNQEKPVLAEELVPVYLRIPQAERELASKTLDSRS